MTIIETAAGLSLHTRRNWLLQVLSILLLAVALVIATGLAKRTTLTCNRVGSAGHCMITEDQLFGQRVVVRFPMRMFTGAEAVPARLNRRSTFYRVNLGIDDGHGAYVFTWYPSRESAEAAATRIREFVGNPHDVFLRVEADKRPMFWGIAAALGSLGVLLLAFGSQSMTVAFDGQTREVTLDRTTLWRRRQSRYALDNVSDFQVAGLAKDSQLYMIMADGRRVPLGMSSDPDAFGGPRRVRAAHAVTVERLRTLMSGSANAAG